MEIGLGRRQAESVGGTLKVGGGGGGMTQHQQRLSSSH